jgi:hypothetical protein
MRISNRDDKVKLNASTRIAGIACIGAAWMLAVTPSTVQAQLSGVSHPPDASAITTSQDPGYTPAPAAPAAKPSAAIPATAPTTEYGPYVPYRAAGTTTAEAPVSPSAYDPDANIVTEETAGRDQRHLLTGPSTVADKNDPDAGIVTRVPSKPGEIPDGTLLKVRLQQELSTLTTQPGTKFTAEVREPMEHEGRVIVPIGSVVEGRVTWVRGGKRIGGPAAIHLEPRTVTLPDGSVYMLRARVIDTSEWDHTKVDDEGTITHSQDGKKTLAAMTLAAGGPMAAGAVIGGLPGAVIGAGVGAGVGTVIWLKQDRQATLPKDLGLVFSLTEPMSVTPVSASVLPVKGPTPGGE